MIMLISASVVFVSLGCIWGLFPQRNYQRLYFPEYNKDLGELDYDTEIKTSFHFKNTSSELINIKKVKADCRCTDASTSKTKIYPGESGTIEVTFRSSNRSGPENHKIAVFTDAPEQEVVSLSISAAVNPELEIIPRAISFGRVIDTQNVPPREVSVVSRFRQPARIINVSSSNPYIKATLLEKKPIHNRETGRIKIELCGNPPSGELNGNVAVTTLTEKGIINSSIKVMADILGVVETASY